jgi:hypothetical protein
MQWEKPIRAKRKMVEEVKSPGRTDLDWWTW